MSLAAFWAGQLLWLDILSAVKVEVSTSHKGCAG